MPLGKEVTLKVASPWRSHRKVKVPVVESAFAGHSRARDDGGELGAVDETRDRWSPIARGGRRWRVEPTVSGEVRGALRRERGDGFLVERSSKVGVVPARAAEGHVTVARQRSTTLSARHQVENRWNMRFTGYLRADRAFGRQVPFIRSDILRSSPRSTELILAHLSRPLGPTRSPTAGFSLYAVGGSVRDALLGDDTREDFEIDFTTNARPDDIERLMTPLCSRSGSRAGPSARSAGRCGTSGIKVEVTTFRSEAYVDHSRKPSVEWGDSLEADLSRGVTSRSTPSPSTSSPWTTRRRGVQTLFDFYDGFSDLHDRVLRTPVDPDDPLQRRSAAHAARRAIRRTVRAGDRSRRSRRPRQRWPSS